MQTLSASSCIIFSLLLNASSLLFAQQVAIGRIEERRSTDEDRFYNECTVELNISGIDDNELRYIKIHELTKAVDDRGNSLLDPEQMSWEYVKTGSSQLKLRFRSASRQAMNIQELSGAISIFTPSEKNGSMIAVKNFMSRPDKNLLTKSAPVKLVYQSEQTLKKKQEAEKKMQEEELSKMDSSMRAMAEGLLQIADAFGSWGGDGMKQLKFEVTGAPEKLVDLEFIDAKGERISDNGHSKSNNTELAYFFSEEPAKDLTLRVLVETPKALRRIPFTVKNVPLP